MADGWEVLMSAEQVEIWRQVIVDPDRSWVLFGGGTCVLLTEPGEDLAKSAMELLGVYGPVHVATSAADFAVIDVDPQPGWVVTGYHPDVFTYVAPDEIIEPTETMIGLHGRSKRDHDARELNVIHVEDRRPR